DYTTVQAALDANTSGGELFLVGPGTYTDDTINFTANNQTVRGVGITPNQIVTTADATVCNFGAYIDCRIENMNLQLTNPTTAKDLITGSGSLGLRWCHLTVTVTNNIATATQPSAMNVTGEVTMRFGTITYNNSGAEATAIKTPILLGASADIELREATIDVDGSNAAAATVLSYGVGTGQINVERCNITVDDTDATWVVGFAYVTGSGSYEMRYNSIHVTGAANLAYGLYLTTGTTLSIRSMFNHMHVLSPGGGTARSFHIGANVTLISQIDDIV
ncbi:unnamed protein product, partial [marine sediment metagenome]